MGIRAYHVFNPTIFDWLEFYWILIMDIIYNVYYMFNMIIWAYKHILR